MTVGASSFSQLVLDLPRYQ
uniref:Uncharacterized protein n=1 Tax=Rhizophora mucronata TaxID=61149 RepID=A0A2P2KHN6_RHIMU